MSDTQGWSPPDDRAGERRDEPESPPAPPTPGIPSGWSQVQPPPSPGWYVPPAGVAQPASDAEPGAPGQPGPAPKPPQWGSWVSQRPAEVKPGVIPLRPLGVGEILDGAITTMRRHWTIMLGLSAGVVAATSLLQAGALYFFLRDVMALDSLDATASLSDAAGLLAGSVSAFAFTLVFGLIAQLVLQGILTVVVSRAVLGEQVTLSGAWARARGRLLPLAGLSILLVLLFAAVFVAGLVPGLLALAGGLRGLAVAGLFALGIVVAVPAVVYLYVTYALSAAALMLERQPIVAALGRSRRLVRGSWWRVFGILLLSTIIAALIGQIIAIPFGAGSLLTYDAGNPNAVPGIAYFLLNSLGSTVAGTITYPFSAGVAVLLYVDLRMRREGLDLELARAAGVAPPGAPAASTTPSGG